MNSALRDIVRRIWHICFPYTGLDGLDKKLIAYLPQGVGYFIEAGANDGVRQGNTYFLEKRRSWAGLLVEPVPRLAKKCEKNRSKSVVAQVVLVSQNNQAKTLKLLILI